MPVWKNAPLKHTFSAMYLRVADFNRRFRTPIACRVRHSANQAISASTWTTLDFDTEDYDTDNMHSASGAGTSGALVGPAGGLVGPGGAAIGPATITGAASSKIVIPEDGYYYASARVEWANPGATGTREIRLIVDGSDIIGVDRRQVVSSSDNVTTSAFSDYYFTASQYIEVEVYHDEVGGTNVLDTDYHSPVFQVHKIGPRS